MPLPRTIYFMSFDALQTIPCCPLLMHGSLLQRAVFVHILLPEEPDTLISRGGKDKFQYIQSKIAQKDLTRETSRISSVLWIVYDL